MNNQSVSLVATTNSNSKTGKRFGSLCGRSFGGSESSKQTRIPPPAQTKKIVCIEQIVARPYVPCNLALPPLILVNYSVQFLLSISNSLPSQPLLHGAILGDTPAPPLA